MRENFREDSKNRRRRRFNGMPLLWGTKARKNSFQLLFFERFGALFFLWFWFDKIHLRLMNIGGSPLKPPKSLFFFLKNAEVSQGKSRQHMSL
jgi:hypothetical protein